MNITGLDELYKAMQALPDAMSRKCLRQSARIAMGLVKAQAQSNIESVVSPDTSKGLLKKSLQVKSLRPPSRGDVRVAVAIKGGVVSEKGARVGLYGSVLEYGKEGQAPRPWLRPAVRSQAQAAADRLVQEARSRLGSAVDEARQGL